jgi:hypothetical protein
MYVTTQADRIQKLELPANLAAGILPLNSDF